jgi:hypothetical protein
MTTLRNAHAPLIQKLSLLKTKERQCGGALERERLTDVVIHEH